MHLFEARVISVVESASGSEFGANRLVLRFHVEKCLLERFIHALQTPLYERRG